MDFFSPEMPTDEMFSSDIFPISIFFFVLLVLTGSMSRSPISQECVASNLLLMFELLNLDCY